MAWSVQRRVITSAGPSDPAIWGKQAVNENDPEKDGLVWRLR